MASDVIVVWSRLHAIFPYRTTALVNDQRNQLNMMVRFCATFGVATLVSLGSSAGATGKFSLWMGTVSLVC